MRQHPVTELALAPAGLIVVGAHHSEMLFLAENGASRCKQTSVSIVLCEHGTKISQAIHLIDSPTMQSQSRRWS